MAGSLVRRSVSLVIIHVTFLFRPPAFLLLALALLVIRKTLQNHGWLLHLVPHFEELSVNVRVILKTRAPGSQQIWGCWA